MPPHQVGHRHVRRRQFFHVAVLRPSSRQSGSRPPSFAIRVARELPEMARRVVRAPPPGHVGRLRIEQGGQRAQMRDFACPAGPAGELCRERPRHQLRHDRILVADDAGTASRIVVSSGLRAQPAIRFSRSSSFTGPADPLGSKFLGAQRAKRGGQEAIAYSSIDVCGTCATRLLRADSGKDGRHPGNHSPFERDDRTDQRNLSSLGSIAPKPLMLYPYAKATRYAIWIWPTSVCSSAWTSTSP